MAQKAVRSPRDRYRVHVVESFSNRPKIDKERCIVSGVKILGSKSKHGHTYTKECCKNAAPLYEGAVVNIDHLIDPKRRAEGRSYRDRFGRLRDVEFRESKGDYGLYGNLHYNGGHQLASQFEWDVENSPENAGLSHDANGTRVRSGKEILVESLTSVTSVDIVADAATNSSLFESYVPERNAMKVKRKKSRVSEGVTLLESLTKRLGYQSSDIDFDRLQESFASEDVEISKDGARLRAALLIASDERMTEGARLSRIAKLLAPPEGTKDEKQGKSPSNKPRKQTTTLSEGAPSDLEARLNRLERENQIFRMCEGFTPSAVQMKGLLACEDDEEVRELLESFTGPEDDEEDDDDQDTADYSRHRKLGPASMKPSSRGSAGRVELTKEKFYESIGIAKKKQSV